MHTVEKIGGTSMSRFGEVIKNVILPDNKKNNPYNRIFVVSAYGGITDLLLEHKKSSEPGIFSYFAKNDDRWEDALKKTYNKC